MSAAPEEFGTRRRIHKRQLSNIRATRDVTCNAYCQGQEHADVVYGDPGLPAEQVMREWDESTKRTASLRVEPAPDAPPPAPGTHVHVEDSSHAPEECARYMTAYRVFWRWKDERNGSRWGKSLDR